MVGVALSSPSGDALMVDGTCPRPAVDDPMPTARGPAPYTSVVEGRDDAAKDAAYAMLGLSKAPAPARRRPPTQKAQRAPVSQQPSVAALHKGEENPMRRIPEIVVSPPEREIPSVETITALLARLTLAPVVAKPVRVINENLLSAAPWKIVTPRHGTSQERDDEDEVARMLGELVDEMRAQPELRTKRRAQSELRKKMRAQSELRTKMPGPKGVWNVGHLDSVASRYVRG